MHMHEAAMDGEDGTGLSRARLREPLTASHSQIWGAADFKLHEAIYQTTQTTNYFVYTDKTPLCPSLAMNLFNSFFENRTYHIPI
jgi:hypothetical protein